MNYNELSTKYKIQKIFFVNLLLPKYTFFLLDRVFQYSQSCCVLGHHFLTSVGKSIDATPLARAKNTRYRTFLSLL